MTVKVIHEYTSTVSEKKKSCTEYAQFQLKICGG